MKKTSSRILEFIDEKRQDSHGSLKKKAGFFHSYKNQPLEKCRIHKLVAANTETGFTETDWIHSIKRQDLHLSLKQKGRSTGKL